MNKTEQIKREWLQFVDTLPKYVGQTPKDVIADWWLQKLSEQRQAIIEEVEKKIKDMILPKSPNSDWTKGYNQSIVDVLDTVIKILNR